MSVTELKKVLDQLPPECAEFQVDFTVKVEQAATDKLSREDHPVSCSIVDRQSREVLLMTNDTFAKLKDYAK